MEMTVLCVIMFRIELRHALLDDSFARLNGFYLTMIPPYLASSPPSILWHFLDIHVVAV